MLDVDTEKHRRINWLQCHDLLLYILSIQMSIFNILEHARCRY